MINHLSIACWGARRTHGRNRGTVPTQPGFALQPDEHGSGVEVYPAGTELQPGGTTGGTFVKKGARGYGSTHFALTNSR